MCTDFQDGGQLFGQKLRVQRHNGILARSLALRSLPVDYVVVPGDTMNDIADTFEITLGCLIASNPQVTDPSLIFPDDTVHIPCTGSSSTYTVSEGDSLSEIASRFGVSLAAFEEANPQIRNSGFP